VFFFFTKKSAANMHTNVIHFIIPQYIIKYKYICAWVYNIIKGKYIWCSACAAVTAVGRKGFISARGIWLCVFFSLSLSDFVIITEYNVTLKGSVAIRVGQEFLLNELQYNGIKRATIYIILFYNSPSPSKYEHRFLGNGG